MVLQLDLFHPEAALLLDSTCCVLEVVDDLPLFSFSLAEPQGHLRVGSWLFRKVFKIVAVIPPPGQDTDSKNQEFVV